MESNLPPGAVTVVAVGGSAAADDVVRSLTAGRPALAADGHALVLYDGPRAAVDDVAGYLRLRAMTMVRFGLHVGEPPREVGGRLSGPAVSAATRLAGLAGPGRLRICAAAAELLGDTVPAERTEDGSYQMQKGFGTR